MRLLIAAALAAAFLCIPVGDSLLLAGERGDWFKSLKQPGSGFSCCDISDCKPADAEWRDGQWWAVVSGEWTPIPRDKELETMSIDGEAYVCSSPNRRIYCFVRPDTGS